MAEHPEQASDSLSGAAASSSVSLILRAQDGDERAREVYGLDAAEITAR